MVTCELCHRKISSYSALDQHYGDKHPNKRKPSNLVNNVIAEVEANARQRARHSHEFSHVKLAMFVLILILIGGVLWYYVSPATSTSAPTSVSDPVLSCNDESKGLAEHIHPHLTIIINGQQVTIPANIGLSASCEHPIHTHDESGTIHVESLVSYPFTLHDFFLVWGQPFDNTQILQYKVDASHCLRMTVNGVPNDRYQNYVMQDGVQIVITYGQC